MMRYKFRARRSDNDKKDWVYGYLTYRSAVWGGRYYIRVPEPDEEEEDKEYQIDYTTIGQYIGRSDRNGKEIYENQLVEDEDDKYLVVWNEEQCGYQLNLYGPGMYHNEGGGEEWTNDDRDLGYAGIDMDVVSLMEIVKEIDDKGQ